MTTVNRRFSKSPLANRSSNQHDLAERDDVSKRQRRLAKVVNPGANEKTKGDVVHGLGDSLMWWNEVGDGKFGPKYTWEDAVYHNDIRQQLLALADDNGRETYDFPRKQGLDPSDKTAFLASQKAWQGDDRRYWNTIADNILNQFEAKGYQDPEYDVPLMRFQDKVVLDHDNNPVRLFRDLPLTLSSAVEPWLLEAFTRMDSRINKVDIRARMPATFTDPRGRPQTVIGLAGLGNRTMRFREMYGLIPWTPRTGSKGSKQKVLSVMTEEQIANNTTEGLGKFPTKQLKNQRYVDVDARLSDAAEDSYAPMEICQEPSSSSPAPLIRMSDAQLTLQRQYIEAMQAADRTHATLDQEM